jgi:competence protein ComEA
MLGGLGIVAAMGMTLLVWQDHRMPLQLAQRSSPAESAGWERRLADARIVDLNTADVSELERLPGVGPALARRIVAHRQAHGRFNRPEALTDVRGIGPQTYQALQEYLQVAE